MAKPFAKAFYNSSEWQKAREYALLRDSYLCRLCGKPAEEVHHIVHLNPANIYDPSITMNPDNLISLCRDCHFAQHKQDRANGGAPQEYIFDESGQLVRNPLAKKK